jgi:predicted HicB family RNase H-like nuclease
MKNMLSHRGYFGSVEFSDEDDIFHGRIVGISDRITYEGDSVKSLRRDFASAVDEYLCVCGELGKEAGASKALAQNV